MLNVVSVVVLMLGTLFPLECEGILLSETSPTTYFLDLFTAAGMQDILVGTDTTHTVFFPEARAIQHYLHVSHMTLDEFKSDVASLKKILQYHVVPGRETIDSFYNERKLYTMSEEYIRINHYLNDRTYTAEGMKILNRKNTTFSNGERYIIAGLMTSPVGDVLDVFSDNPDLSSLASAVSTANLNDFFHNQEPITVFAPSNAAYNAQAGLMQNLTQNPTLLYKVLSYHVVPGTLYTAGMKHNTIDLPTFYHNDTIHLAPSHGNHYILNSASHVVNANISATNGVVHIIDQVLIPDSLKDQL